MIDFVKPAEVQLHPAATLFPEMSASEFASLKADIEANGLLTPVTLWRGQIVDGRHRSHACDELGVDWQATAVSLADTADPYQHAISANATRRQLTKSQLAMIAVEHRAEFDARAKERQLATLRRGSQAPVVEPVPQGSSGRARDQLGTAFGISGKTVDAATAVHGMGAPELIEAVKSGDVPVLKAAVVAKGLPQDEQAKAVAANRVLQVATQLQRKPKAKPEAKPKPPNPDIWELTFQAEQVAAAGNVTDACTAIQQLFHAAINAAVRNKAFMAACKQDPTDKLRALLSESHTLAPDILADERDQKS